MNINSTNNACVAENGMVATSQPLAVEAGLEILKSGGNAVDAAIATAICLTVVEPTSNGIGGDAFAMVWDGNELQGLNASGHSAAALNLQDVLDQGQQTVPETGWLSVTVPGAPSAWHDLHDRYGKLPFSKLFDAAIYHAENGFEITPVVAFNWQKALKRYASITDPACQSWMRTFSDEGRAPQSGEIWRLPDHARTLEMLAKSGADSFYCGEIASEIIKFSQATDGLLSHNDLSSHCNLWVDPVSVNYRGIDVFELPPNGQGLAALLALSVLSQLPDPSGLLDERDLHQQIEAMKLALVDAYQYITDPAISSNVVDLLLDPAYIRARANRVSEKAENPDYGTPPSGGTVYLCTADKNGMMVSYIQSNYEGFGSGVVIPETGIAMQNRGASFSLDPAHPNKLEPAKRPFHTIIPGFLMENKKPLGPFGVMGGFMQPQGHLQVLSALIDHGLDPQAALDLPRWRIIKQCQLEFENGFNAITIKTLEERGHEIELATDVSGFGRGQIILKVDDQYVAGSDRRADGMAKGY